MAMASSSSISVNPFTGMPGVNFINRIYRSCRGMCVWSGCREVSRLSYCEVVLELIAILGCINLQPLDLGGCWRSLW